MKPKFFSTDFRKIENYQFSWKSDQWGQNCSLRTNIRIDMTRPVVAFLSCANVPINKMQRGIRITTCMYVCMCVCVLVCMYVCMYVCVYVCVFVCMYVCMYVCMCVCLCVCMFVCVFVCMYICVCVLEREREIQGRVLTLMLVRWFLDHRGGNSYFVSRNTRSHMELTHIAPLISVRIQRKSLVL